MTTKQTVSRVLAGYQQQNEMAANLIAADPVRYQGVLQEWADLILSKAAHPDDSEAGPLFKRVA
jgi:hypothetical protein